MRSSGTFLNWSKFVPFPMNDTFLPQTQEMGKKVKKAAARFHPKMNPCYYWGKNKRFYSPPKEVGRGSFGIVFKGDWAGTKVELKQVKLN